MGRDVSRRAVLRAGAAAAGTGTLGGLAGCGTLAGGGGDFPSWLPAPGTLRDTDHYGFSYLDAKAVRNNEENFDDDRLDGIARMARELRRPAGVTFDTTIWILTFQDVAVVGTSLAARTVAGELDDRGYLDDEYGEYTVYFDREEGRAVGVSDDALVFAKPTADAEARTVVERVVETRAGESPRYRSENADFDELVSKLGTATAVTGGTLSSADGVVATGGTTSVDGDTSNVRSALVFRDASAATTDAERVQDEIGRLRENSQAENFDTNKNGRTVFVSGSVETTDLSLGFMTGGRIA